MYRIATKLLAFVVAIALMTAGVASGENDSRKVKNRVEPAYPELARRNHVAGTVRIQIVIGANGQVKSTKPLGGHPLLVQSAESAVKRWRYEQGAETTTVIEFHFHEN